MDHVFKEAARALGVELAQRQMRLIYGGGNIGLMGVVAEAAIKQGGHVIGVIPESLMSRELGHRDITELHVVNSMHERKQMMASFADSFIAMPGGIGTLEELFEILTWAQLSFHDKPIGLLNVDGYFDYLLKFLDKMVGCRFITQEHLDLMKVEQDASALLDQICSQ